MEKYSTPQEILSQAYIIGGSPCSGKSTLAGQLSRRYDFQYYKVDDYQDDHIKRCHPDQHPVMHSYLNMDWNARWARPVAVQVQELFQFYRERFEMVLQDLLSYQPDKAIIIEGAAILPELIAPYRVNSQRTLFMIPTQDFQLHYYRQRPWINLVLQDCDDPVLAFVNWMERDYQFGQEIARQARAHRFPVIEIDRSISIGEHFEQISRLFGLTGSGENSLP